MPSEFSPSLSPDFARKLPDGGEQVYDLLRYVSEQGPKVNLNTRGRAVSAEFMEDLALAGQLAVKSISRLVVSASGRLGIFDALLGCPAHERSGRDEAALLELIAPFIPGDTNSCGYLAGPPVFLPAFCGAENSNQADVAILPKDTACAVGNDLETVFVSADLGFRHLFLITQIGAVHILILRALDAELPIDQMAALHDVCALLDCDAKPFVDDSAFAPIYVLRDGRSIQAQHTICHPDT